MADYCGWDIGGVHLKLSRLRCAGDTASIATRIAPFEIWTEPAGLAPRMRALLEDVAIEPGAAHAVTMTTVSPSLRTTAPWACRAMRPVSIVSFRPPISMSSFAAVTLSP